MAQNSFFMDTIKSEAMQVGPTPTVITASLAKKYCAKNGSELLNNFLRFISNHFVAVSVSIKFQPALSSTTRPMNLISLLSHV